MSREFRILAEIALDVVIAVSLVVVAGIGSGWCQTNLTPNVDLGVIWFAVWMVPFVFYARWRGVLDGDLRKPSLQFLFFTVLWQMTILLGLPAEPLLVICLFPMVAYISGWIVEWLMPVSEDNTQPAE